VHEEIVRSYVSLPRGQARSAAKAAALHLIAFLASPLSLGAEHYISGKPLRNEQVRGSIPIPGSSRRCPAASLLRTIVIEVHSGPTSWFPTPRAWFGSSEAWPNEPQAKVAADKQVVYNGKHYFAGDTFSADDDDPEVDRYIERGYVSPTAKGGRDKAKANRRKPIENHFVAQQRGLDPQGIDGLGPAPPETQEQLAREHFERFFMGMSRS
jgi:hypothetical protein